MDPHWHKANSVPQRNLDIHPDYGSKAESMVPIDQWLNCVCFSSGPRGGSGGFPCPATTSGVARRAGKRLWCVHDHREDRYGGHGTIHTLLCSLQVGVYVFG